MAVNTSPPVQLQNGTDQSQKDAFINENFRALVDSLNPFQISDGNTNILSIGQDSTGKYSMKVAKTGFDAYNATDDQLVFNSNQNNLKVLATGTAFFTVPAGYSAGYYGTVLDIVAITGNNAFYQFDIYSDIPTPPSPGPYRFKYPYSKYTGTTKNWDLIASAGSAAGFPGAVIHVGIQLITTGLTDVVGNWIVDYTLYQESF